MNIWKPLVGILDILCPIEDMADFLNLQGKLEPMTLKVNLNL